jgi:hypothetical protein
MPAGVEPATSLSNPYLVLLFMSLLARPLLLIRYG